MFLIHPMLLEKHQAGGIKRSARAELNELSSHSQSSVLAGGNIKLSHYYISASCIWFFFGTYESCPRNVHDASKTSKGKAFD